MRYRQLAPGIDVSEVGFGNWTVTTGWWGDYTREESLRLHREAFDHGITFFDTSDAYAEGYAEEVLGEAIAPIRDEVVIATKFGYDITSDHERVGQQERAHRTDVAYISQRLDDSLKRLGVETIDFYQLHNPRMAHIDADDLWAFLEDAKEAGKIRAYGVALGPKIGWLEEGVHAMRTRDVHGMQVIFNMLEQSPGKELLEVAEETGRTMIVRVPHSSGMLEGNLTADHVFPKNDHRRHRPRSWLIEGVQKVATLDFLTEDGAGTGMTLGQAALKWVLSHDRCVTTLPNIYGSDQIAEFAAAPDKRDLTLEELDRVQALYDDNFGVVPEGLPDTDKVNGGVGS
ncbi:aldo/keto reductase [Euzebya pacifica]|jgi:aryl-alcohol dehydrogenase-like predicted oxidoreductase|uniref:aldo/keto reductase n=1 Tax=Euzebya pacifica TaxID=1608957 RepID=UPI0030FBDF07